MALEVWRRVVSVKRPLRFDSSSGMLDLRACSLLGDSKSSKLSVKSAGSSLLTLVNLSETTPCSKIRSVFQENVEFTCNGGDVLVVGALLPILSSRGVKRSSTALDAQASTPKRAAMTLPVEKSIGVSTPSEQYSSFKSVIRTASEKMESTPQRHQWIVGSSKAEKRQASAMPISHRVFSSGLAYDVLKVGSGAMARFGKPARVRYEGRLSETGKTFDSGEIKFRLGMGEVVRAWDEGIQGMLAGERRRLYVPPRLGYGAEGRPPTIPPGAGLMFEVELLEC